MPPSAPITTGMSPQNTYPQDSTASSPPKPSVVQQASRQSPLPSADTASRSTGTYLNYSGSNGSSLNGYQRTVVSDEGIEEGRQAKRVRQEHRRNGSVPLASSPTLQDEDGSSKGNAAFVSDDEEVEKGGRPISGSEYGDYTHSSEASGTEKRRHGDRDSKVSDLTSFGDGDDEDDPFSHAADILASAKKRLMNMEGNLSRARYSLNMRPSSAMSSTQDKDPHQANMDGSPTSTPSGAWDLSPAKNRQGESPSSPGSSMGHSRVFSETSVPSSLQTTPFSNNQPKGTRRSSSAMDSIGMSPWGTFPRTAGQAGRSVLQPLTEDELSPMSFESTISQENSPKLTGDSNVGPPDHQPSTGSYFDKHPDVTNRLSRSTSNSQMRDLRDQMQDLKGRISSLKERAHADTLRRRSMQSLRTSNPFTSAEQWYRESSSREGDKQIPEDNAERKHVDRQQTTELSNNNVYSNGQTDPEKTKHHHTRQMPSTDSETDLRHHTRQRPSIDSDDASVYSDHADSPVQQTPRLHDNAAPSDESLARTPPSEEQDQQAANEAFGARAVNLPKEPDFGDPTYSGTPPPVGSRHEDRADAFDYEHFFLHSGMGNFSKTNPERRSSHDSTDSAETTKQSPAREMPRNNLSVPQDDSTSRRKNHPRQNSIDSISTVATFATATEGKGSDDDGDEDEWIHNRPMAGSWQPDYPSQGGRKDRPRRGLGARKQSDRNLKTAPLSIPLPRSAAVSPLPITPSELSSADRDLVDRLLKSLGEVTMRLQADGPYDGRKWRRRLDAARRILDGEVGDEVV